jgi:hypothetical protein
VKLFTAILLSAALCRAGAARDWKAFSAVVEIAHAADAGATRGWPRRKAR